jgi:hypothetical protein
VNKQEELVEFLVFNGSSSTCAIFRLPMHTEFHHPSERERGRGGERVSTRVEFRAFWAGHNVTTR